MNEPANLPSGADARRIRRTERGFTLVEIMVVIVIIGLLATLVAPNVLGMGEDAKVTKAESDVKAIYDAATYYRMKNPRVPSIEDLTTPDEKGKTYLHENSDATDPWGNAYVIRETERNRFEVVSFGPDGAENTDDDISSSRKDK